MERPTRSPSDSRRYCRCLCTEPTLTESVFSTGSPHSDRVVVQEAGTVAAVATMPFAGHDEIEAALSSTHLPLGSGLEENTPRRS